MQSIDLRGRQGASGTLARATDPFSRPAEPPSMLPNDPSTQTTLDEPNEDASDLDFDLDSLPYSKPESHTRARLIIEDFLDIKSKGLRDHELWSLFRHAFARWTADEFSLAAKQAHGRGSKFTLLIRLRDYLMSKGVCILEKENEELRRQNNAIARDLDDLPLASNPNDLDGSDGDPEGGNRGGSEWNGHGGRGRGHGGPIRGQGNEPLRDPGRGYEPLGEPGPNRPLTSTLFSTRVLARHSTLAYGTLGDPDDDFLELGTTDPYSRAKELALFARSFPKELKYSGPKNDFNTRLRIFADHACRYGLTTDDYLAAFLIMLAREAIGFYYNYVIKAQLPTFKANAIAVRDHFETDQRRQANYDRWEEILLELIRKENPANSLAECFEKLERELRTVQRALRPGLRDDKSLADKLYSACKNVLETTIARMNLAITSTAAIADIRRAIAFATESLRPPAKASRAYASSSEPFAQHSSQHSS
ncbi:glycosyl transferase [Drepanopeziza brunnea f. sp. 'multigermtubi' MB_m1]|uniref:Glycosyl transferase n=1 Tax=Marssonina brunnea f. sp. multigermtubi (strain MB_m1) TaxID=1072389 RepID=K1XRE2_MARBU|nr:glycosyl transferase [Drepanopeziza brunnea f. sp. 'multigermtubi' MB_m1]EKD15139.1 glycosyl transferase [Drepanopeziza brunnea f. sp. 'multigermtubi' MB_m1]